MVGIFDCNEFYDCNYQNVSMYHRIAIIFYSHFSCSYADVDAKIASTTSP